MMQSNGGLAGSFSERLRCVCSPVLAPSPLPPLSQMAPLTPSPLAKVIYPAVQFPRSKVTALSTLAPLLLDPPRSTRSCSPSCLLVVRLGPPLLQTPNLVLLFPRRERIARAFWTQYHGRSTRLIHGPSLPCFTTGLESLTLQVGESSGSFTEQIKTNAVVPSSCGLGILPPTPPPRHSTDSFRSAAGDEGKQGKARPGQAVLSCPQR